MLRVIGPGSSACDGISRRELMRVGALSLFPGMTMPRLLQAADKAPATRPAKAQSVILLNLFGGPSHLDMFDMKPDAPSEIRGEFKPIATSIPGLKICEHLPKTAKLMHRATLIRTVTHHYNSHHPYAVLSGFAGGKDGGGGPQPTDHPSMGSVCQYSALGRKDVPGYVFMPAYPGHSQNPRPGAHAGYLGRRYDPLFTRCDPKFERSGSFYDPVEPIGTSLPPSLEALPGLTVNRLDRRHSLLGQVGRAFTKSIASPVMESMNDYQRQAFTLLTSGRTRDAFDTAKEPLYIQERYGRHLYGTSMLAARRLVEAGTTFVAITWECAVETHGGHWDMHQNNFGMLRFQLPLLDQVCAALIEDLAQRDLLDSTLVVVTGEMGRTPKVNGKAGRDHWPSCCFCLLAGGGVKSGMVFGASDKHGGYPIDRPVSPGDLVATIYQLLGVDPEMEIHDLSGRPVGISHGGKPIWDVIM